MNIERNQFGSRKVFVKDQSLKNDQISTSQRPVDARITKFKMKGDGGTIEKKWPSSSPNLRQFNKSLEAKAQVCNIPSCEQIFKDLSQKGLKFDNYSFDKLLSTYTHMTAENQDFLGVANKIFEEYQNIADPDIKIYNHLIRLAAKEFKPNQKAIDTANLFFKALLQKKLKPNNYTFGELIDALQRSGKTQEAFDVFDRMNSEGIIPFYRTYKSLISLCVDGSKIKKAEEILAHMEDSLVTPEDVQVYNQMIKLYRNKKMHEKAYEVYEGMQEHGAAPDIITYTSLAATWYEASIPISKLKPKDYQIILDAYDKMQKEIPSKIEQTTIFKFISIFLTNNQFEYAKRIFLDIKTDQIGENLEAYSTMINYYSKVGDQANALLYYKKMQASSIKPDLILYTILVNLLIDKKEEVLALLKEMKDREIKIDSDFYLVLITFYSKNADFKTAISLFEEMQNKKLELSFKVYNKMVNVYVEAQMPEKAQELFNKHLIIPMKLVENKHRLDFHGMSFEPIKLMLRRCLNSVDTTYPLILIVGKGSHSDSETKMKEIVWREIEVNHKDFEVLSVFKNDGQLEVRRRK